MIIQVKTQDEENYKEILRTLQTNGTIILFGIQWHINNISFYPPFESTLELHSVDLLKKIKFGE